MSIFAASVLVNCILLVVVIWFQVRAIRRMMRHLWETWQAHRPRRWKPQSPHDCPHCQGGVELQLIRSKTDLRPYSERKSCRGRKKCVSTGGFASPNARCVYCGITDESIHALVGYGKDNGLRPLIQTAFVERVNLTFRQSVAALSRRTWAYAQTKQHLRLHCEWFRLYYHFIRAHESLALEIPGLKRRYRQRSPAMALQLTDHLWSVCDLLHHPVPQAA